MKGKIASVEEGGRRMSSNSSEHVSDCQPVKPIDTLSNRGSSLNKRSQPTPDRQRHRPPVMQSCVINAPPAFRPIFVSSAYHWHPTYVLRCPHSTLASATPATSST